MKTFRVNKNVHGQPYIFGLPLTFFYIFSIVIVISVLLQLGGLSLFRLILGLIFIVCAYVFLKFLDSDTLNRLGDEDFPKSITIDNFK